MTVSIQCKQTNAYGRFPTKAHDDDAGWDLYAACPVTIYPREQAAVPTGVAVAIPSGHYGQLQSRSGLTVKHEVTHRAGVIDSGYRGELVVLLRNESDNIVNLPCGSRIAQLVIHEVPVVEFFQVNELPPAERGENGFGSSGQ